MITCTRSGNEVAGSMPSKRVAEMSQSLPSPKRSRSDVDVPLDETNEIHSCEKCGALDLPSWAARCTACWRLYFRSSDSDFYLRCPFEQKDEAKKRGAAFDSGLKKWYVPAGKDISKCETWFLGGGFKYFLFSPLFGEDYHFDSYFSKGLKPPTRFVRCVKCKEGALDQIPRCFSRQMSHRDSCFVSLASYGLLAMLWQLLNIDVVFI